MIVCRQKIALFHALIIVFVPEIIVEIGYPFNTMILNKIIRVTNKRLRLANDRFDHKHD